ncbi:hypothetical protein [Novosphingobium sp.]|uniref:hypothetical protein n=1 Tax=Novosphingobium sp. TaxID=1874826 RepID=UPI0025EFB19D|nr:hypothetical protein [Novosphingobium sp.]
MTQMTRRGVLGGVGALAAGEATISSAQIIVPAPRCRTMFQPGERWLDTSGKPIQAHGGSLIQVGDTFYWYGKNKEKTVNGSKIYTWGVRAYASHDLYNWDDLGLRAKCPLMRRPCSLPSRSTIQRCSEASTRIWG